VINCDDDQGYLERFLNACPSQHRRTLESIIANLPDDRLSAKLNYQMGLPGHALGRATAELAVEILFERDVTNGLAGGEARLRHAFAFALDNASNPRPGSWSQKLLAGTIHGNRLPPRPGQKPA
jgi:hypothetical protein